MLADTLFGLELPVVVNNLLIGLIAITLGLIVKFIFRALFKVLARFWPLQLIKSTVRFLGGPITIFFPLWFLNGSLVYMRMDKIYHRQIDKAIEIALIITFAVILIRIIKIMEEQFYLHYDLNKEDNLKERKVRTQLQFVRKFLVSVIVIIAISSTLR